MVTVTVVTIRDGSDGHPVDGQRLDSMRLAPAERAGVLGEHADISE
jgi:hypothetical protein